MRLRPESGQTASASWQALGMLVQVVITDGRTAAIGEARQVLARELDALDAACGRFRPDSEVTRIAGLPGDAAGMCTTTVSLLLAEAIAVTLRAAALTDGDVDPTVGAALAALGYDRDFARVARDGEAVPVTALYVPGWASIELDPDSRRLRLPAGVLLDFGATVKGWAADQAAGHIARELGCGALVSLGGDTAVAGRPPAGGWRIRVPDVPGLPAGPAQVGPVQVGPVQASSVQAGSGRGSGQGMVVAIRDGGLATSSAMARRWRRGTDILHHILDPRSGLPAAQVWHSVSVAAASCADANTAAVAAIIRGHQAPGWLAGLGLPARLVATDGTIRTVAGWPGA